LSAANVNETTLFPACIDALPTIARKRGRPRWKPDKVHADKGYDSQANRDYLQEAGILSRIARRGIDSSQKLGKHRWVIERTFSWLNRFRRLKIRYERRDDIHEAFLLLGCALICWNCLQR
jgi:IS5 family transposase